MSTRDQQDLHRDLGVYVLGALELADRDRFEGHLSVCDGCRAEFASLAVLPALLARLRDEPGAITDACPPLEPVLARLAGERRRERRRHRMLVGVATLSTLLAVAMTVALLLPSRVTPGRAYVTEGSDIAVFVEERPWGMAVRINARELPARRGYAAFAVAHDGHRAPLASWSATDGPVELRGSCYLRADDVAHVEILAAPDDEVLHVLQPG